MSLRKTAAEACRREHSLTSRPAGVAGIAWLGPQRHYSVATNWHSWNISGAWERSILIRIVLCQRQSGDPLPCIALTKDTGWSIGKIKWYLNGHCGNGVSVRSFRNVWPPRQMAAHNIWSRWTIDLGYIWTPGLLARRACHRNVK